MRKKVEVFVEDTDITLDDAFKEFLEEKSAHNRAEHTLKNYEQTYNYFCDTIEFNKDTLAKDVKKQDVYKWTSILRDNAVKVSSINHYLRDMRCFLYWCMNEERKYIEPSYKIELITGQEEELKYFDDDEVEKLLEKPINPRDFIEWRTWAIVNWVLATGSRANSICNIKIKDVDFAQGIIHLRQTKNNKYQSVPLSSALSTAMKEYIRKCRKNVEPDAWLFPNYGEEQLTTNAIRLSFSRYCNARKVSKTSIHGLRHTFARLFIKNGGRMADLQVILGHSTLDMTKRYIALFAEDIKKDYDNFSPLDSIKKKQRRTKQVQM